mmetsp:Transcript_81136/g.173583  ORF Transcript_81136/g.173583 Transcript_81136/m.173583 type:complete len:204 (+) Transcript_81136:113-724(+)
MCRHLCTVQVDHVEAGLVPVLLHDLVNAKSMSYLLHVTPLFRILRANTLVDDKHESGDPKLILVQEEVEKVSRLGQLRLVFGARIGAVHNEKHSDDADVAVERRPHVDHRLGAGHVPDAVMLEPTDVELLIVIPRVPIFAIGATILLHVPDDLPRFPKRHLQPVQERRLPGTLQTEHDDLVIPSLRSHGLPARQHGAKQVVAS